MLEPPVPIEETQRLRSLLTLRILDTPSEERFDRITRLAKRLFDVDICLVSLVDSNRQWFKSKQGLDVCATSRAVSFCGHAVVVDDLFVVADTSKDDRFADNPLVVGEPHIRFYAGVPVHGPGGHRIGTFCIIDSTPRNLTSEDAETLCDFASMVDDELRVSALATIDELTQIANRRGFYTVADHALELCRRTGSPAELLLFDLDGFKSVNDAHGHHAGDELLRDFSRLLVRSFRGADVVARLGGDEFAVLMCASEGASRLAAGRLRALSRSLEGEHASLLDWSYGSAIFDPKVHKLTDSLLLDADRRMFANKAERCGESSHSRSFPGSPTNE